MMSFIKEWLLGVTCAAMVLALAESLAPEGGVKRVCRLAGGLVLLLAAVSPVVKLDSADLSSLMSDYSAASQSCTETLEAQNDFLYEAIIVENTTAYILDKTAQMGLDCRVTVTVAANSEGVICPQTAVLIGSWTREQEDTIRRMLESDLGIPTERQYFERTEP